jgi:hypothetical protein
MSIVSDFVTNAATQSFAMIGAEAVVIGATTISCILAEVDDSRDYAETGFEVVKRLTATCKTSALPATEIIKKTATARGIAFRVAGVNKGGTFSTITLEEATRG